MKIYIAGPISNNPDYKDQFSKVEEEIVSLGHTPLNPCKKDGFSYKEYIDMGLMELSNCQAILMLDGWKDSIGAKLEHEYAKAVGIKTFYTLDKHRLINSLIKDKDFVSRQIVDCALLTM